MNDLIAVKSNWLIEASYRLSLQEQRFMLSCIAKINPRKPIPRSTMITAAEFYENFPDVGKGNAEKVLHDAVNKLWERSIIVADPNQTEEFRWIQRRARYHKGEARVSVTFSEDIAKYLTQLSEQFTQVTLKNVSGLKSVYSIRIYELCQQFIKTGERTISVADFKSFLQLEAALYTQFKRVNDKVVKPSIKELNAKSNLEIEVEPIKNGREIVALRFRFKEKEQLEMNLDPPQ